MRAAPHRRAAVALAAVIALAALGVTRAVLAADDRGDDWSPIVYPLQRLPLTFSHARHLGRGTACAACHPRRRSARSVTFAAQYMNVSIFRNAK